MAKEYSLTKADRLLKPVEFSGVIKNGRRFTTKSFTVYVLKNSFNRHRLGLAVSARVTNGPGRVKLKRLLREFFRLNKKKLSFIPSGRNNSTCHISQKHQTVDIVFSAKRFAGTEKGPKRLKDIEIELFELFDSK